MNLNQLSYINIQSSKNLLDAQSTYGVNNINDHKELLKLMIIRSLVDEAEWYSLPAVDLIKLKAVANSIIRSNKYFMFDTPTSGIYANTDTPQTSFTFDQIII